MFFVVLCLQGSIELLRRTDAFVEDVPLKTHIYFSKKSSGLGLSTSFAGRVHNHPFFFYKLEQYSNFLLTTLIINVIYLITKTRTIF